MSSNLRVSPPDPLRARSATAKSEDKCEVHPYAKIPHTNGECRQNEANPKFKLKFKKRDRGEEADQKVSKPKYDSSQKVLFIEEEESDIDEIYLNEVQKVLCDPEKNMSGVGFTPNKNLCIKIPRRADPTTSQLEDECLPLTYDGLMKWHEKDSKGRHFLESSSDEEESFSSSDCISVDSDELFRKTGIERWPPKPKASDSRLLLERNEDGEHVNRPSTCVESVMEVRRFPDMTKLVLEGQKEDAKKDVRDDEDDTSLVDQVIADYPMEFEFDWYDKHSLLTDEGWEIAPNKEQEMSPPAASNSENVYDYI